MKVECQCELCKTDRPDIRDTIEYWRDLAHVLKSSLEHSEQMRDLFEHLYKAEKAMRRG